VDAFNECVDNGIITEEELGWLLYKNAAEVLGENQLRPSIAVQSGH
jgi:hypothetical protein